MMSKNGSESAVKMVDGIPALTPGDTIPFAEGFEGRTFEPQKVSWMVKAYPAVSGHEYRRFRKANGGMTHHDFTIALVTKHFGKNKATRNEIITFLVTNYVAKSWPEDDLNRQIPQYLAQLTFRGWSALINAVSKVLEGRAES